MLLASSRLLSDLSQTRNSSSELMITLITKPTKDGTNQVLAVTLKSTKHKSTSRARPKRISTKEHLKKEKMLKITLKKRPKMPPPKNPPKKLLKPNTPNLELERSLMKLIDPSLLVKIRDLLVKLTSLKSLTARRLLKTKPKLRLKKRRLKKIGTPSRTTKRKRRLLKMPKRKLKRSRRKRKLRKRKYQKPRRLKKSSNLLLRRLILIFLMAGD